MTYETFPNPSGVPACPCDTTRMEPYLAAFFEIYAVQACSYLRIHSA
jgi:hypothetical protein